MHAFHWDFRETMGTCALATSKVMCKWSSELNTKKYLFAQCLVIVLSIVTFLAVQKKLIYPPHLFSLSLTFLEGLLLKW